MTAAAAVPAVLQHLPVETVAAAAIFKTQIENFTIKKCIYFIYIDNVRLLQALFECRLMTIKYRFYYDTNHR